jgi:cytoskeletal protein RodZ
MKNCPKCHVDFSDDFSFCEFDGTVLDKVFEEKKSFAILSRLYELRRFVPVIGVVFIIGIIAIFILAKTDRQQRPMATSQNPPAAVESASFFVETPQAARDFSEEAADDKASRASKTDEKPGVEVTLPGAKPTTEQPPVSKSKAAEKPSPVEPDSEPVRRPAGNQRANSQPPADDKPATSQPSVSRSPRPQIATNQEIEDDRKAIPRANANANVNMNLVRVRSYRTEAGVRYDLTFTMQQNEGRLIRWERLNLLTRSASGITHSEVVPFYQRLGTSGSLNFTVSVEMRGRTDADIQGRITCTGTGTDVEGRSIKTDFTTRVTP